MKSLARPFVMAGEIAWWAPQVIARRTVRVVRGGWPPTPRTRRELGRMVGEKVVAAAQTTAALPFAAAGAATSILTPVHRRVRANHRRLG
ncbi:hypothetical protein [Pseudonocardia sp. WMMC193]|uniref:hypothetical protein n=1 Tax=Pseudonocardia sp. WMMC193 TaxID=2911965 RepID=UPI001F478FAB|nr:hypothetical protein [Pseudonocardia sp. WMMC193]MCF7548265.1 hypothetical protein [Pseudonocardia sp. WMMC193]